uniref:Protein TIFY n=1 Tax=Rhizophora mucronata TaxID=61149 RepID=A0A2P2IV82_RHIMU
MEVEYEGKPGAVGAGMNKREQEVAGNSTAVAYGCDGNLGSCKDGPDSFVKVGLPDPRLEKMTTSGPDATIPAHDQFTIFYGGKVVIFDAIPAEKVREIVLLAAASVFTSGEMKKTGSGTPTPAPVLSRSPSMQSTASGLASPQVQLYPVQKSSLCNLRAELPMARRHSLQRFFEKRRDRLVSKGPYPTSSGAKLTETTKSDLNAEASHGATCFGKPLAPEEEHQPKFVANLA